MTVTNRRSNYFSWELPLNATISLFINEHLVTNKYRKRLNKGWTLIGIHQYLHCRENWTQCMLEIVNCEHIQNALKLIVKTSIPEFIRDIKFMIDMPHPGRQTHKFTTDNKNPIGNLQHLPVLQNHKGDHPVYPPVPE